MPGTPCKDMSGYCDVFAVCRQVDAHGPLIRLKEQIFTGEGIYETKIIFLVIFVLFEKYSEMSYMVIKRILSCFSVDYTENKASPV